jgi:spermidine synthase
MRRFFAFFLVSGFCSLVYQVVWLRLAMADFGVTTTSVSLVLSLFMAGLGLGSYLAGRWTRRQVERPAASLLKQYAVVEFAIGLSALAVPLQLDAGRALLDRIGGGLDLGSGGYHLVSGVVLAFALLPWTTGMGATFPLVMSAIEKSRPRDAERSFSYLYLANVLGAVLGTLTSAFVLIELLGFAGTMRVAMGLNVLLGLTVLNLARSAEFTGRPAPARPAPQRSRLEGLPAVHILLLLLLTGTTSMAMEVLWVRQFTPYLGTVVYAFAAILGLYLVATFVGSRIYRARIGKREERAGSTVWMVVGAVSLLPLMAADYRLPVADSTLMAVLRVTVGIAPFCAALGYLTPMLVDVYSGGDPDRAGAAYAVNVVGSLIGPLLAGFVLLPLLGERPTLVILAVPLLVTGALVAARRAGAARTVFVSMLGVSAGLIGGTQGFERQFEPRLVLHDSTATVIATGEGMNRALYVNGTGITNLTPMTKMMAHLPMSWRDRRPESALVVCFGMGTSFRSLHSWGADVTGVELVPSVVDAFAFFHEDAEAVASSPRAHIVVDDGRRYLERTDRRWDVITIDPPPPVEAAGSSLLYSREFCELLRDRLTPDGILQQWVPGGDGTTLMGIAEALFQTFPHVRLFRGLSGWGTHLLASMEPLPDRTAADLLAHMPPAAVADMLEWGPETDPQVQLERVLGREIRRFKAYLEQLEDAPVMLDDRPLNEYFLLRRARGETAEPQLLEALGIGGGK